MLEAADRDPAQRSNHEEERRFTVPKCDSQKRLCSLSTTTPLKQNSSQRFLRQGRNKKALRKFVDDHNQRRVQMAEETKHELVARRLLAHAQRTDIAPESVFEISIALSILLADIFALYIKTKNFHWHMSGPHFRDYHLLLDE